MKSAVAVVATLSTAVSADFVEKFDSSWTDRWVQTTWKESAGSQGEFTSGPGEFYLDKEDAAGIMTEKDHRFYGVSANFDEPISNKGKDLIIQYQVKYDKDPECGGGYLKVGPKIDDQKNYGDPTKYYIMFGPDKCGYTKRTHVIFNYKDKNLLKKSDIEYKQADDKVSSLYRLTVQPDNSVKVDVDRKEVYSGKMTDDWEFLKPKEISDPDDKKPEDWVDEEYMDDPEDKKPEDWVEEEQMVDTEAQKPEGWDDEEDGEWEAPMITNPGFKGEWHADRIDNPAYKGEWKAKQIPNEKFVENVYDFTDLGSVGFELWTVNSGSIFDNIYIGDSLDGAWEHATKHFDLITKGEKEAMEEWKKANAPPAPAEEDAKDAEVDGSDLGDEESDTDEEM